MALDPSEIPGNQKIFLWDPDTNKPLGSNSLGLRANPQIPFYRIGEPRIFQVGPDTASLQQALTIPDGAMSFRYVNNNPFSVRLRGTPLGMTFQQITPTTGWLWLPGTSAIFTSVMPALISCMSVDGPNASVQAAQKAGVGVIELQYGLGGR
ncbi:hypothetical protein [Methylobacterium sp. Gmos1]